MEKRTHLIVSLLILTTSAFFSSCNAYKELPYLKNGEQLSPDILQQTAGVHEAKIMPNDIISITVNSSIPGATTDFNLPVVPANTEEVIQKTLTTATSTTGSLQNYIVDKNGDINFPVLGELKLGGLTTKDAQDYIATLIYPKYITVKPIVNIRLLNFEVSVLGEVARPGIYNSKNGQMTILDALAAAGDMTVYGKRDNVLLVRTEENGKIAMYNINLQDKNLVLNKDLFYLQQNDKLIVETNKAKGNNSRFGSFESISLSAVSIIISVVAILIR